MNCKLTFVAIFIPVFIGCSKSTQPDKVVMVSSHDPDMTAAIKDARASVSKFQAALGTRKLNQTGFAVKMAFTDGEMTEHFWLDQVRWDGTKYHGVVNNDPEKVSNVKLGQEASVAPEDISDWMYVENGKLVGGYTIRALRAAMSPKERAEFDESTPFKILD